MLIRTADPEMRDGLQTDGVETGRGTLGRHFDGYRPARREKRNKLRDNNYRQPEKSIRIKSVGKASEMPRLCRRLT